MTDVPLNLPDEPVVEPSRGPADWLRRNLFRSWLDTAVTIVSSVIVGYVIYRLVRFIAVTGRWDIVERNLTLLMVGRYPRDELWRVAVAMIVVSAIVGLVIGYVHARQVDAERHKLFYEDGALTPASYHSIDAARLARMRDGAVLINSARGAVIDEEALVCELKTGRIRAVLDVFETEPLPADHVLRNRLPNVLNMPHVAAASQYWRCRQVRSVVEDVDRVLAGEKTRNEITLERYRMLSPSYK